MLKGKKKVKIIFYFFKKKYVQKKRNNMSIRERDILPKSISRAFLNQIIK